MACENKQGTISAEQHTMPGETKQAFITAEQHTVSASAVVLPPNTQTDMPENTQQANCVSLEVPDLQYASMDQPDVRDFAFEPRRMCTSIDQPAPRASEQIPTSIDQPARVRACPCLSSVTITCSIVCCEDIFQSQVATCCLPNSRIISIDT